MHPGAGAVTMARTPAMGAEFTYPTRAHSLDNVRDTCQLTPHEYNHIARVQVQAAQVESAELRRARIAAECRQDEWAAADHGPVEAFNAFLAYLFCAPSDAPRAAGHEAASLSPTPNTPEPDLVFLDGTAAAALERARDSLTATEYDHMLRTQLRLAELDEEAERDRARRTRPRRLPLCVVPCFFVSDGTVAPQRALRETIAKLIFPCGSWRHVL